MFAKTITAAALVCSVLFSAAVSAGPLTGKSLGGTNSTGTLLPSTTALVGAGVEFTASIGVLKALYDAQDEVGTGLRWPAVAWVV